MLDELPPDVSSLEIVIVVILVSESDSDSESDSELPPPDCAAAITRLISALAVAVPPALSVNVTVNLTVNVPDSAGVPVILPSANVSPLGRPSAVIVYERPDGVTVNVGSAE